MRRHTQLHIMKFFILPLVVWFVTKRQLAECSCRAPATSVSSWTESLRLISRTAILVSSPQLSAKSLLVDASRQRREAALRSQKRTAPMTWYASWSKQWTLKWSLCENRDRDTRLISLLRSTLRRRRKRNPQRDAIWCSRWRRCPEIYFIKSFYCIIIVWRRNIVLTVCHDMAVNVF